MTEKAHILISCEIGEEQSLYSQLMEFAEIKTCLITYGSYDLVAELETHSADEMNQVIASKIRRLEKIRSTVTLHAVN